MVDEIISKVDMARLEKVLMSEGAIKFANPQKELIKLIASKRAATK
jgi:transaldolase